MGTPVPAANVRPPLQERAISSLRRLVTSSLLLYLAVVLAQRGWTLLNSDVGLLLRRLH